MKIAVTIYTFLILAFSGLLKAEEFTDKRSSFEGRHFLIGFMQNEVQKLSGPFAGHFLELFISSTSEATMKITGPTVGVQTYKIPPDSVLHISLNEELEIQESEELSNKILDIESDVPITVSAFNSQYTTSDSYTAIPVAHWGREYVVMSYPTDQYYIPIDPKPTYEDSLFKVLSRQGEFLIVGAYDGTEVTVNLRGKSQKGMDANTDYKITLNKGQAYLVQSDKGSRGEVDLTGSIVKGNKPFGVISGHVRTAIPQNIFYPKDTKDHLVEMLFPTSAWGNYFVTAPFGVNSTGDHIRVAGIESDTRVDVYSHSLNGSYTLKKPGDFIEFNYVYHPALWVSDKPIQIAQYMQHFDGDVDNPYYDPCMIMIPPTEQFVQRTLFQTPGNNPANPVQYTTHVIMVIANEQALYNIKIDDELFYELSSIEEQKIFGTDFYYGTLMIEDGKHEIVCDSGGFAGIIYGYGHADSYGMVLGSALTNPQVIDSLPPRLLMYADCGNLYGVSDEIHDRNSSGFDYVYVVEDSVENYNWDLPPVSDTATFVNFNAWPVEKMLDGKFMIDLRDKSGNVTRYSYIHRGVYLDISHKLIDFESILASSFGSESVTVKNIGNDTVRIDSVYFANGDPRLSLVNELDYPIVLDINETGVFEIAFDPGTDTNKLNDTLVFKMNCERYAQIPILANILSYALHISELDFGEVYLGDKSCNNDELYIINEGNVDIIIEQLNFFEYSGEITYDTLGLFPTLMHPGDTLFIPCCFEPTLRQDNVDKAVTINNLHLDDTLIVRGKGIAPDIPSLSIDFGRQRAGTSKDTVFYLYNWGNTDATVTFTEFTERSEYFDNTALENMSNIIPLNDSLKITNYFAPGEAGSFTTVEVLNIDWDNHSEITIELMGEGTLPEISTLEIDFDTLALNLTKDTIETLLTVSGNEGLTVDSVVLIKDGRDNFIIGPELTALIENNADMLSVGTEISETVTYAPKSTGLHEMIIRLYHDGAPAYERTTSDIIFRGFSNVAKTEAILDTPFTVRTCQTKRVDFYLYNQGTVPLDIQALGLSSNGLEADWAGDYESVSKTNPIEILPDEEQKFGIDLFSETGEDAYIDIDVVINDTINHNIHYDISPIKSYIQIQDFGSFNVDFNQKFNFTAEGSFSNLSEKAHKLDLNIFVNQFSFMLLSGSADLIVYNGADTVRYPALLSQEADRIAVVLQDSILLPADNMKWQINFELQSMLFDDPEPKILIEAKTDKCFDGDSVENKITINEICVSTLRNIENLNLPEIENFPNPVTEKLKINMDLYENDYVNIELIGNSGKKFTLSSNLYLIKGSHSLIFEITDMPSGVYVLSVQTSQIIRRKRIIINK